MQRALESCERRLSCGLDMLQLTFHIPDTFRKLLSATDAAVIFIRHGTWASVEGLTRMCC